MKSLIITHENIVIPRRKFLAGMGMAAAGVIGSRANPIFFGLNQTASGGGGGSLILDSIGTSAFAAYSVARRLRSGYSGSPFQVRRASDGALYNTIFDGDILDIPDLESWCAGSDGFIRTTYDQTGNSRHATQTTDASQPKIVSAGVCLLGSNGRAAATFDGVDDLLQALSITLNPPVTYFFVVNNSTTVDNDIIFSGGGGSSQRIALKQFSSAYRLSNGVNLTSTDAYTLGAWDMGMGYFGADGNGSIRRNNHSLDSGSVGTSGGTSLNLGSATLCPSFKFSEFIIYNAAIGTPDETTVRDNINSFYTLF